MSKKSIRLQAREKVAERWTAMLVAHYGRKDTAKLICRDFDVDLRTARSWLTREITPEMSALYTAAIVIGVVPAMGVLFPDTEEFKQSKLREDLTVLRSQLDSLSAKLGELDHENSAAREKVRKRGLPDDSGSSDL